jgi:hypothetical protein
MPPSQPKTNPGLISRIKPAAGLAPFIHTLFRLALPLIVFVLSSLSNIGFWLPLRVVLLSKWRLFAVKPRFWPANVRANSVDIMVGISVVIFMVSADSWLIRLIIAVLYAVWLLFIKPKSSVKAIALQAGIGQLAGLLILSADIRYPAFGGTTDGSTPTAVLVFGAGLVCYLAARHFFDSYNEPYARMLSYIWGYFGAALLWVLSHLLVVYPRGDGIISQPVLFLSVIGYTLGAVYYLEHFDKLSTTIRRELFYICGGAIAVLLVSLYYEGMHLIV